MKSLWLLIAKIAIINYNSSHLDLFSFGLSSAISKISVTAFEHVFVSLEKYFRIRVTIAVAIAIAITQQTNPYSNSATETLKKKSEIW